MVHAGGDNHSDHPEAGWRWSPGGLRVVQTLARVPEQGRLQVHANLRGRRAGALRPGASALGFSVSARDGSRPSR